MEIKRLITHFTYRIEPKPEGGFIAHATDPSVPPLEAPTREELQQKIQANIATAVAAEFPGRNCRWKTKKSNLPFTSNTSPAAASSFSPQTARNYPSPALPTQKSKITSRKKF
jgi:hypothetical protein